MCAAKTTERSFADYSTSHDNSTLIIFYSMQTKSKRGEDDDDYDFLSTAEQEKKKKKSKISSDMPRRPLTAYNFFQRRTRDW